VSVGKDEGTAVRRAPGAPTLSPKGNLFAIRRRRNARSDKQISLGARGELAIEKGIGARRDQMIAHALRKSRRSYAGAPPVDPPPDPDSPGGLGGAENGR